MRNACLAVTMAALLLSACGSHGPFRDRGNDYLAAETTPPLSYPDGVPALSSRELYPVPAVEQRRRLKPGEKAGTEIPAPPALPEAAVTAVAGEPRAAGGKVPAARVNLARDGNDYPVLMLDLSFDWAWQVVGDALQRTGGVKVDDVDRERAVYYLVIDGTKNSAGDPWQLKLNHTANGIQVALQVDEDAMAPRDVASPLMQKLRDGILQ